MSGYLDWKVGDKIVCINVKPLNGVWDAGEEPVLNQVYTVKSLHPDRYGTLVVHLDELSRTARSRSRYGEQCGYGAWRFRKVQKQKTDISVFMKMLKTPLGKNYSELLEKEKLDA